MDDQEYEVGDELGWAFIFGVIVFVCTLIVLVI